MKVVKWISWEEADKLPYMYDDEHIRCLVDTMKSEGFQFNGSEHQYCDNGAPMFDDGTSLACSMRVWGDIMAKVKDMDENDFYSYTVWAWTTPEDEESILPPLDCKEE